MNKLLKHISPFAPDISGACSVLYETGGLIVVCDAGGCAGNVCGFDEPRWLKQKAPLFSAGLRDMDAILGRDEMLVEKLSTACEQIKPRFSAIVGTPVPAVIATDYKALEKKAEKKTGLPCICIDTDGTKFYDEGEEKAYYMLFKKFTKDEYKPKQNKIGIIGATPLNTSLSESKDLKKYLNQEAVFFSFGSDIEEYKKVLECEELLVISPSGLKAAKYLNENFGIKYNIDYPFIEPSFLEKLKESKKTLTIHQDVLLKALKDRGIKTDCATFFKTVQEDTIKLKNEEDIAEIADNYERIVGDISLKKIIPNFKGDFIDLPFFGLSGRMIYENN